MILTQKANSCRVSVSLYMVQHCGRLLHQNYTPWQFNSFNNIILRKIWSLPRRCHTAILHCVGGLQGIHNIVITRSNKLISSAQKAGSCLLAEVFTEASTLMYTSFGYNHRNAARHWKSYSECDKLKFCANFIRDARLNPELNHHPMEDINYNMCCT